MTTEYRIKDWEKNYTVAQSRKVQDGRPMPWVAMRTKHDGKGYRRVMKRKDAMAMMGAWMLIVEVAAKCPEHGVLNDGEAPLTPSDLSDKTGGDERTFATALEVFAAQDVGWLVAISVDRQSTAVDSHSTTVDRQSTAILPRSTEVDVRYGTVRYGTVRSFATSSLEPTEADSEGDPSKAGDLGQPEPFERFWCAYPKRDGKRVGKASCKALYAKLSVEDREHCILAAANYARSTMATEGFAKDPERFLKKDFWRDWLEPQVLETPSRVAGPEDWKNWNPTDAGLGARV